MTLDEAIKHCNAQVELLQRKADYTVFSNSSDKDQCIECANDHRQLAKWLTELKETRQLLQLVRDDMEFMMSPDKCRVCGNKICTDNTVCRWRYQERLEKYFLGNVE